MGGIFWFREIFWKIEKSWCVCRVGERYCLGGCWEWLFSGLRFGGGVFSLMAGVCFQFACCLGEGWPSHPSLLPLILHRTWFSSAAGEDRSSQAQIHAVWSWHFPMWELKSLLTALSFSLWPVSQGGGQLGGSHIGKLGGAWGTLWPGSRSQI